MRRKAPLECKIGKGLALRDSYLSLTQPLTLAVFTGKDASRALGMTSTKPEDVVADWSTLSEKEKGVLEDWVTFFSKRYNIVGVVAGATNMD